MFLQKLQFYFAYKFEKILFVDVAFAQANQG